MHVRGYDFILALLFTLLTLKKETKKTAFFDCVLKSIQNTAHVPTICFLDRQNAKIPTYFTHISDFIT